MAEKYLPIWCYIASRWIISNRKYKISKVCSTYVLEMAIIVCGRTLSPYCIGNVCMCIAFQHIIHLFSHSRTPSTNRCYGCVENRLAATVNKRNNYRYQLAIASLLIAYCSRDCVIVFFELFGTKKILYYLQGVRNIFENIWKTQITFLRNINFFCSGFFLVHKCFWMSSE